MRACVVFGGFIAVAAASSPAHANRFEAIFTRDNQAALCVKNPDGQGVVSKEELANVIVESVRVPLRVLYKANPGATKNFVNGDTLRLAVSSREPFGPNPDNVDKAFAEKLAGYRLDFGAYPPELGRANGYLFPNAASGEALLASTYFQEEGADIVCTAAPGSSPESRPKTKQPKDPVLENILVRKTVDDLGQSLKKSSFATLAYEQKKAGSRVISAESVVGFKLLDLPTSIPAIESLSLIPYVRYSASHGGKSTDTEVVQPGFVLKSYVDAQLVFFRVNAMGSYTFDNEHDAQKSDATLALYPVVNLGGGRSFLGGPLPPLGALSVTPDVLLLASESRIEDAGTNVEYKKAKSYASYGAVPKVQFAFISDLLPPYLTFLAGFGGTLRYHFIENSNDVKDVRYLDLQFAYSLPQSDNWSVTFDVKRGEDPTTLQSQNYWKVGLGFRY